MVFKYNHDFFGTAACLFLKNIKSKNCQSDKVEDCRCNIPQTSEGDCPRKHFEGCVGEEERKKGSGGF